MAGRQTHLPQRDGDIAIFRFGRLRFAQQLQGLIGLTLGCQCLCRFDSATLGYSRCANVFFQKCAHLALGQGTAEFIGDRAVDDQLDRWQAADTQLRCDLLIGFGIDLGQREGALIFFGKLGEDRHQRFARLAPVRPEIHQYRSLHGTMQYHAFEILACDIDDIR